MELDALDHVGLLVSDIDRSIEWYERVLGLKRAYQDVSGRNPAVLVAKGTGVSLFPGEGSPDAAATFRPPAHVCFRLSARAYESARAELERADIKYSESDHRVSRSLYVHDPDLHLVEITSYEIAPEKELGPEETRMNQPAPAARRPAGLYRVRDHPLTDEV